MRGLWVERDHGLYVDPSRWPREAMATTTTPDLQTVAGWWQGRDIDWRAQVGLFAPEGSEHADRAERHEERTRMWAEFRPAGIADDSAAETANDSNAPEIAAAFRFFAGTTTALGRVPIQEMGERASW